MEWVYLEGIQRVNVSYKEDVQYEFDELVDSILCLNPNELSEMLRTVRSDRLFHLIQLYKN